jgi:hypothetical protein
MTATKLDDFKPGDLLEITSRNNRGEEVRAAVVMFVNYNDLGYVTFTGDYSRQPMLATGSGAFKPEEVGTTKFGLCVAVKKVGHRPHHRPWSPKPGDSAYDSVH